MGYAELPKFDTGQEITTICRITAKGIDKIEYNWFKKNIITIINLGLALLAIGISLYTAYYRH